MNDIQRAKAIINGVIYISVATVSREGNPWNTPVFAGFDEKYNFFWVSWVENQHSKNIRQNPNVFITIFDSSQPEGTGEGIYIQAQAYELNDTLDIEYALQHYNRNSGLKTVTVTELIGNYPRRMYKAVPEKFWLNGESEVNGNYVDIRVEVKLI